MTQNRRTLLATSALLLLSLAGCAEPPAAEPSQSTDPLLAADGRDLRAELEANDEIPRPAWRVGQWFGHHIFFDPDDTDGLHMNVMITEDQGSDWFLATDDATVAGYEAMFDIPLLGPISKAELTTTGFGGPWSYYDFPLTDGKTWQGKITPDFEEEVTLDFTATLNRAIQTPYGPRPGYDIVGVNQAGDVQLVTDYVPEVGWYTKFTYYDMDDLENFALQTISMGYGQNWTGTYYVATAEVLLEHQDVVVVDPAGAAFEPHPYSSFTVDAAATYLSGFRFQFTFGAAHEMFLVDPNHEYTRWDGHDAGTGTLEFELLEIPAVPGDWHLVSGGAGVAQGAGLFLWQITETTGQM